MARFAPFRLGSRLLRFHHEVLERVDVDEGQDGAVDLVVGVLVGPNLHPIPVALPVLDLSLCRRHRVDDLGDPFVQIGDFDVRFDIVERAADVRLDDVQNASRLGREAADPPLAIEDDDRNVYGYEQIQEIAVDQADLLVPDLKLVIDGGQLFIRRLQLFLRRLQLLVHALELFVARHQLLVGRAEIVIGASVLLDESLQVLLGRSELVLQARNPSVIFFRLLGHASSGGGCLRRPGAVTRVRERVLEQHDEQRLGQARIAAERKDEKVAPLREPVSVDLHPAAPDGRHPLFASATALRKAEISPGRAIMATSLRGAPGAICRNAPVRPRN